jgi:ligand-binding SRPBCC domain-containing protein
MATIRHTFTTTVPASAEEVWAWSTSIKGIKAEMWPVLKITFPKGMTHIGENTTLDKPLCRCQFLLLGLFPIDMSKLTFVEQSPLLSMRSWRHERIVTPTAGGTLVTDNLTFKPRVAGPIVGWFVKLFFEHRHAVLAKSFAKNASKAAPGHVA